MKMIIIWFISGRSCKHACIAADKGRCKRIQEDLWWHLEKEPNRYNSETTLKQKRRLKLLGNVVVSHPFVDPSMFVSSLAWTCEICRLIDNIS